MKISVIVSSFNRGNLLEKNLTRLSMLSLPDEIVIVDDGSSDNTREVADKFKELLKGKTEVKYIYRDYPHWDSCSIPKNIGLKNATGDILIYTEPENIFIDDVVKIARELPEDKYFYQKWVYFGKGIAPAFPIESLSDPMKYLEEFGYNEWVSGTIDVHGGAITYTKANMVSPWCLIVRKKDLMHINGWDEEMSALNGGGAWGFDDIDLITRLRCSGINGEQANLSLIHQWHDRPPQHIQDSWKPNEDLMNAKKNKNGEYRDECIIANQYREWGKL